MQQSIFMVSSTVQIAHTGGVNTVVAGRVRPTPLPRAWGDSCQYRLVSVSGATFLRIAADIVYASVNHRVKSATRQIGLTLLSAAARVAQQAECSLRTASCKQGCKCRVRHHLSGIRLPLHVAGSELLISCGYCNGRYSDCTHSAGSAGRLEVCDEVTYFRVTRVYNHQS